MALFSTAHSGGRGVDNSFMTTMCCAGCDCRETVCREWHRQQCQSWLGAREKDTWTAEGPALGAEASHAEGPAEDDTAADVHLVHQCPVLLWPSSADNLGVTPPHPAAAAATINLRHLL